MPYAEVNGARLFYTDEGSGPPVLLVHGYTCDSQDWIYQMPALLPNHRVIAVDLRGHGHSSAPPDGYTSQGYAADLAALLEQLHVDPVIAVGHSMGGAAVVALAVEHPGTVRALVPIDAGYGNTGSPTDLEPMLERLAGPDTHAIVAAFFRGAFYPPASPPHLAHWHARRIQSVPREVLFNALAGMCRPADQFTYRPKSEAYLARVTVPALIFRAGMQDPQAVAQWERSCFSHPYSRAIAWEGSGHFLHQERPAEFNAILAGWIAGLDT